MQNVRKAIAVIVSVDLERNMYGLKYFIKKGGIDKVYLFYNKLGNFFGKVSKKNSYAIRQRIKNLIECEEIGIDTESFESCYKNFFDFLRTEKVSELLVDISSTTKIASSVILSLSLFFNIRPYLVVPENAVEKGKYEDIMKSKKFRRGVNLYEIPIIKDNNILKKSELSILKAIKKSKDKITSMTHLLNVLGIKISKNELIKLKYVLNSLERKRFVTVNKNGRKVEVSLSFIGKLFSEIDK